MIGKAHLRCGVLVKNESGLCRQVLEEMHLRRKAAVEGKERRCMVRRVTGLVRRWKGTREVEVIV